MLENYEKLAKLGDGAQGSVYKVRHRTSKKEFALKMIRCRDSAQANLALKEIKVLIQLSHRAIVTYTDFFLDFDTKNPKEMLVCLVMELCEEKHFEQLIKSTKSEMMMSGKHPIPEDVILSWISQAAHALEYIHEKGFMHRDLKPSNIFFAANEGEEEGGKEKGARRPSSSAGHYSSHFRYPRQLKLGDFGLATAAHPNGDLNKSTVGTPYYFAPEQMLRQKYDNKVDIWALGSVMLELICLRDRPINSEVLERPEVVESVVGDINRMGFSKGLAVIIRDMLCRHPASRPTSAVLVERVRSLRSAPSSRIASAITSRNVSHNNSGCEDSLVPTAAASGPLQSSSTSTTSVHIRQCEMCTAKPAKFICGECGESFCSECDAVQHRVSTRSRHRRTEIVLPPPNATGTTVPAGKNGLSREIEARLALLQLAPIPCQMCEEETAAVLCPECDSEAYCKKCDELKHINPRRRLHERHVILRASSSVSVRTPTFASSSFVGGGPSAPSSRKNSPKADPLAATLAGGMVIKGGFSASIINTTTIIPPPLLPMTATMATGAARARRVSASAFTSSALETGVGRLGIGRSDTPNDGAPPEPNVGSMAPVAEPKLGLSPTRSLTASTIFGCPSADVTSFAGNPPKSRNASPVRSRSASMSMGVGTNTLVATLRSNSEYPFMTDDHDAQNPYPMPRQCPPKRTAAAGGSSSSSSSLAAGCVGVPPLSIRVPSDDCPTLEEALAAIAAAVEQRKLAASRAASEAISFGGALPSPPPLRNDRIVVVGDLTISSPLTIPFPVDIIGRMAALSGTGSPVDTLPMAGETPTLVFSCTPAFTLSHTVVTAGSPTSSSSTSTAAVSATYSARVTTNVFCGMLANLNIRHDSTDFPPTVNRAKVAAIIVDGGQWRVERCRLSSVSGHGLIAEGLEACARVIDCAVISTKLCGIMLLNGTAGEVCNTHVVGAKQTGVLVRKNVTTRLKKNQIKQNGETGVYIVDAKPVVEENDISNNNGCGVVVKGEDAAPTIRENTIAMNTQAGIFYCDGAKGAACDNVISENQRAGVLIKTQANPTITRNIVRKSKETGVYCFEGGRGTITHNTITDNLNAGVLVTTGANVNVSNNRIHKNYYEALWICKNGAGTFQNNDLRGNRKGPKDVEEGSQVAMAGNLES